MVASRALVLVLVAFLAAGCSSGPPKDWRAGPVSLSTYVTSDQFAIYLSSISCNAQDCSVVEQVTNNGSTARAFDCSEQTATRTDGKVVTPGWVTLGSGGSTCFTDDVKPGESIEVHVSFRGVNGLGITEVTFPGSSPVPVPVLAF